MGESDVVQIVIVFLCLGGSMFFSGSETAITSFDTHRAQRIVELGGRDGRIMSSWVRDPVRVLSTILVGNNLTNTLMATIITSLALRHFSGAYEKYAELSAVAISTVLLLIFGEITPKAVGRVYNERVTIPSLWILRFLSKVMAPFLWLLTRMSNWMIRRLFGESDVSNRVTSDEIGYLVKVGSREGSINADQAALLQGIVRFEDKIVRDIMVPVDRITAVDLAWEAKKVREVGLRSGHSRLPVYDQDLDNIRGVLHIKQLVGLSDEDSIQRIVRPPVFISESLRLHDLLRRFKEQRVHLAIVVDDGGDTVGIVTLEDVLEQIVGQIFDESDRGPLPTKSDQGGICYFDGQDSLTRVEEKLAVEELEELEGVDSVGDLLTRLAGQIPIAGSVFVWENLRFKVLAADAKHVIRVSVERVESEHESPEN